MSASKITEYLLRFRPTTEWIVEQSHIPYLPIDLAVPAEKIYHEWQQVQQQAQSHRDNDDYGSAKNVGWKSLTLYGLDKHNTGQSGPGMHWTDTAQQCPETKKWLTDNFAIGPDTGRIRFMLLEPGGFIVLHKDRENKQLAEFNIAITNPKNCVFRFKNYGTVPFAPGTVCMMDVSNEHFVVNNSDQPRLHIIVHGKLNNQKLIADSYANRYYNQ